MSDEQRIEYARWMREHGMEPGQRPKPAEGARLALKKAQAEKIAERLEAAERYAATQNGADLRHANQRIERLEQQLNTLTASIWEVEEALTGPSCPHCGNPYPTVDYGRAQCSCQNSRRFSSG